MRRMMSAMSSKANSWSMPANSHARRSRSAMNTLPQQPERRLTRMSPNRRRTGDDSCHGFLGCADRPQSGRWRVQGQVRPELFMTRTCAQYAR